MKIHKCFNLLIQVIEFCINNDLKEENYNDQIIKI